MNFLRLAERDVDLILSIQKDNFLDGWNKEQLISAFNSGDFFAVGLDVGGRLVGLITYSLVIDVADIEGVVVLCSERGKGYGKALVDYAVKDLTAKGAKSALLEVREGNNSAIALYLSRGFGKISVRKKYYSDGENALVMKKELISN